MFKNELEIYTYLNKHYKQWSNDMDVKIYGDKVIVITKLTINNVTRTCQSVNVDVEKASVESLVKCISTFDCLPEKTEEEQVKEEEQEELLEFTEENLKKQVPTVEQIAEDLERRSKEVHPLIRQGLMRQDQIDFMQEFTKVYKIQSDEQFNFYLRNWGEHGGVIEIDTKAKLVQSGTSVIDNFISFINRTGDFHLNGIKMPDLD